MLLTFDYPQTRSVRIENYFTSITHSPELIVQLNHCTRRRDDLRSALTGASKSVTHGNPEPILSIVEEYARDVIGIISIYDRYPKAKPILWRWKSPIGRTAALFGNNKFKAESIYFELSSVLMVYIVALNNKAAKNCATASTYQQKLEMYRDAVNLLRKAAGVMDYIRINPMSSWQASSRLPPELNQPIMFSLHKFLLAQSQEIAYEIAELKNISDSAKVRIAHLIFLLYHESFERLRDSGRDADYWVNDSYGLYLRRKSLYWRAITFKLLGLIAHSESRFGSSVGYLKASANIINSLSTERSHWPEHFEIVERMAKEINNLAGVYERENLSVYFETIPKELATPEPAPLPPIAPIELEGSFNIKDYISL